MKTNLILAFCILLFFFGTCDYVDNRLQIKNNSNEVITVDFSENKLLKERINDNIKFFIRDKIVPGDIFRKSMPGSKNGWPFLIQRSENKRLNVFFINVDTLAKYNDWDIIRKNELFKRKEYTKEELEKNKWIIQYP